jgi:hypothetical protein
VLFAHCLSAYQATLCALMVTSPTELQPTRTHQIWRVNKIASRQFFNGRVHFLIVWQPPLNDSCAAPPFATKTLERNMAQGPGCLSDDVDMTSETEDVAPIEPPPIATLPAEPCLDPAEAFTTWELATSIYKPGGLSSTKQDLWSKRTQSLAKSVLEISRCG